MLLPDAREILELAAQAQRRVAGATGPLRVGHVSWLPEQLTGSAAVDIRLDEWVMPSHVQIARVLDGGLDAAVAWAGSRDERLDFQLLWPEPLLAVTSTGGSAKTIPARKLHVLVDADLTSWQAWNDFATEFAEATGARLVPIDDGGIAGTAFHDRALRLKEPCSCHRSGTSIGCLRASARARSSTRVRSGAGRSSPAQTTSAKASPLCASTPATRSSRRPHEPFRPARSGFRRRISGRGLAVPRVRQPAGAPRQVRPD
jgi:hypothetical protein